jgi:NACalpha-BTF3-like transcription factor
MNEQRKNLLSEIMQEDDKDGLYNTQTAVEWFYQRILAEDIKAVFEQAKVMEKEQITKAWKQGNLPTNLGRVLTAEEYYNETYNK